MHKKLIQRSRNIKSNSKDERKLVHNLETIMKS